MRVWIMDIHMASVGIVGHVHQHGLQLQHGAWTSCCGSEPGSLLVQLCFQGKSPLKLQAAVHHFAGSTQQQHVPPSTTDMFLFLLPPLHLYVQPLCSSFSLPHHTFTHYSGIANFSVSHHICIHFSPNNFIFICKYLLQ